MTEKEIAQYIQEFGHPLPYPTDGSIIIAVVSRSDFELCPGIYNNKEGSYPYIQFLGYHEGYSPGNRDTRWMTLSELVNFKPSIN